MKFLDYQGNFEKITIYEEINKYNKQFKYKKFFLAIIKLNCNSLLFLNYIFLTY